MLHGTEMPSFGDIWRKMQKELDGSFSKRTADDEAERMFWKRFIKTRGPDGKDEYSSKVLREVGGILGTDHYRSITETGPGWGNYTFDLAEMCDELVCVDISPDVLNFVKRRAKEESLNIKAVCSKWEDYPVTQTDVVFGFNCFYRMQNIEDCLRKVDEVGTRVHIIGMTSGPEQPYYIDFEKKLGLRIKYDRLDYILLVNMLYQLGIDCNVRIVPLTNEYVFSTFKNLQQSETRRILTEGYDEASVSRILRKYFKREEDGRYHYIHKFNAALIYWRLCRSLGAAFGGCGPGSFPCWRCRFPQWPRSDPRVTNPRTSAAVRWTWCVVLRTLPIGPVRTVIPLFQCRE